MNIGNDTDTILTAPKGHLNMKQLKIYNKSIWFNIPNKIVFQTFVTSV